MNGRVACRICPFGPSVADMTSNPPIAPRLDLAAGQAEELSGINRKTLARMAARGVIVGAQPGGRRWRYSSESIRAYLEEIAGERIAS